ncbi:A1pp-domain-containing protein [Gloeophyllum trabeum ATCC 11539]|uniref:A1pp-domain-containing protein n=1 Tax=Gloeophyllum trabeum (strain ATCC 11539 / FP-39264 / Madison 617) TaxID=670483 RepID=S7Q022_GLOTA|nr:A1pp-domain-containing protein [Gloeophyllum trabeum ATCC 11539]EPQ52877.1 A1pp-domain-containing protein [Gloeophyllum trabeum ATCC 11539]
MPVRLSQIKTVRDLFRTAALRPASAEKLRYPPKASLLDRVSLYQGDITQLEVDAIVNAANKSLLGGGGVDGAIHDAAGPELLEECRTLNGCETGDAKITKGYNLPSRHVIHTIGPVYSRSNLEKKAEQLASCYRTSLQLAADNALKHVAFPSISTGIYGYPITDATHIALTEVHKFLDSEHGEKLDRVIFVVWSNTDKDVYEELLPLYFPPEDSASEQEAS